MTNRKGAALVAAVVAVTAGATGLAVSRDSSSPVTESPLSNEMVATPVVTTPLPPLTGGSFAAFQKFVTDTQAAKLYQNWIAANCGAPNGGTPVAPRPGTEAARWYAFRNALLNAQRVPAPAMTTFYGRALIDAGIILLNGSG